MVSSDFIENEFLKERSMDELSEEEQKEIIEAFLVVSVDPDVATGFDGELTEEELEELKVESSPEYEAATEIYYTTSHNLLASVIFGSIFLILLTLKLDDRLKGAANWWAVFSPFWIERGGRLLWNLYKCCCAGITGEEIVLYEGVNLPTDTASNDDAEHESKDKKSEEETSQKEDAAVESTEQDEIDASKGNEDVVAKKGGKNTNTKTEENAAGSLEKMEKPKTVSSKSEKGNNSVENDGDGHENTDDDGDDDGINLDEETFNAWQSAYQEANKDANQKRAQSSGESCLIILQLILLCLVVAKIEKNYDNVDPDDVGFNVFWILFPLFLFFGLSLCCCAMVICGARPIPTEGEAEEEGELDLENPPVENNENEGGTTIISVEPSEETEAAVEAIGAPEKTSDEAPTEKSEPSPEGDMDDLD